MPHQPVPAPARQLSRQSCGQGNIPTSGDTGVHAIDDVVLQSSGPGSESFRGYMEQSDVYRVIAEALALGARQTQ